MASPQRPVPPRPQPELKNLEHPHIEKEVSGGWRFGFWWIWVIVIVLIWYVGYGWGNHGGFFRSHPVAQNDAALSGPGVDALQADNKARFVGQTFQIRNVPVAAKAGNDALWIGQQFNGVPMLLVLPKNGNAVAPNAASIVPGDWVDANGSIYAAPNAAQAKQQWNLSDADVARLEKEGAYVQATGVQVAPH